MRFLVTGGAGFIGSQVVRVLAGRGDEVVVPVRDEAARDAVASMGPGAEGVLASVNDRTQMEALVARSAPEAAIHLAWYAKPADYRTSPENLRSLQATIELTQILLDAGCSSLVYAGTCFEYAESDGPRRESDATRPASLYAACKLAAGSVSAAMAAAADRRLAWARIFFPYGPGENRNRLLPLVARKLAAGEAVELTDGTQVRDQVHVEDVASAFIRIADAQASGAFNVCTGVPVTMRETVETLGELVGRPELLRFGVRPTPPGEPAAMYGDTTRLKALGWAPKYPAVREGLGASLPSWLGEPV